MRRTTRQIPYLEVIAILWFVRVTVTVNMAGHSVRVQRGPLLRIHCFETFYEWPFALLHELKEGDRLAGQSERHKGVYSWIQGGVRPGGVCKSFLNGKLFPRFCGNGGPRGWMARLGIRQYSPYACAHPR